MTVSAISSTDDACGKLNSWLDKKMPLRMDFELLTFLYLQHYSSRR